MKSPLRLVIRRKYNGYKARQRQIRHDATSPTAIKRSLALAAYWREKRGRKYALRAPSGPPPRVRHAVLDNVRHGGGYKMNDKRRYYREEYLKSGHWKTLRDGFLAGHKVCAACGTPARDVHHVKYRQLYNVTEDDLRAVCRRCHDEIHRLKNKGGVLPPEELGMDSGRMWAFTRAQMWPLSVSR